MGGWWKISHLDFLYLCPTPVFEPSSVFDATVQVQRQVQRPELPQWEVSAVPGVGSSQKLLQVTTTWPDQVKNSSGGLFMNMVQIWLTSGHGGHTVFVFAFTAESITERRSAFTSPGWVSTLWCWLWLLSWDWAASSTDIRPKKPALGGTWHPTRDFTLL